MRFTLVSASRSGIAVACLSCLLFVAGCGGGKFRLAPVSGTVTYKGKPVPQGTIMFQPTDSRPAATGDIKNGKYVLKTADVGNGAVLGDHRVTVIALEDQAGRLPEERNPLPPPIVPLSYSFPDKSGLTAVVKDESNVIDFALK